MLVHKASNLVGTRRFVRIAAKPVVNVMVKAHSASAIVIVEHVAERISAGCRNRGKIRSLVQRADQEADGSGGAAVKFLLPPPECACWRSPVNRDSKQSARTDERSHVLKRAPHLAGVVEDTPAVNNVMGPARASSRFLRTSSFRHQTSKEGCVRLLCCWGQCRPHRLG